MEQTNPRDREISQLIDVIRTSNVRDEAYQAAVDDLVRYGPAAVAALQQLADEPDAVVRYRAIEIIARIGDAPAS